MKIKGKQDIEYLMTKDRYGQIVRVYQVDNYGHALDQEPLNVPIIVGSHIGEQTVTDLLEERDTLKREVKKLQGVIDDREEISWRDLHSRIQKLEEKKKWKFWK